MQCHARRWDQLTPANRVNGNFRAFEKKSLIVSDNRIMLAIDEMVRMYLEGKCKLFVVCSGSICSAFWWTSVGTDCTPQNSACATKIGRV